MNQRAFLIRFLVLMALALAVAVTVYSQSPIPQDQSYHVFAAIKGLGPIPNWQNVLSNMPFILVGFLGLKAWWPRFRTGAGAPERAGWFLLFLGVFLTGFGSTYYHWSPSNSTLVWDRLPMALGFMGLFAAMIGERIGHRAYRLLLWPLVGVGISSVLYWDATERIGAGDLRLYLLVQFLPLLTIPLIMVLFEPKWTQGKKILVAIGFYALAKILEHFDLAIWQISNEVVSGHAVKHLAAAMACWVLVGMFRERVPVAGLPGP